MLLRFGCLLGYKGSGNLILFTNLPLALLYPTVIDQKLAIKPVAESLKPYLPPIYFISLGLVPKHDGGSRKIHHLFYPEGFSVNDLIANEKFILSYTSLAHIFANVVRVSRNCIVVKQNIKDAFRNIPVAPHAQCLLRFGRDS